MKIRELEPIASAGRMIPHPPAAAQRSIDIDASSGTRSLPFPNGSSSTHFMRYTAIARWGIKGIDQDRTSDRLNNLKMQVERESERTS